MPEIKVPFRKRNPERAKEHSRRYYQKHKEEIKAKAKLHPRKNRKEYNKTYREKNRSKWTKYFRDYRTKCRRRLISSLGSCCAKCGFDDWRALQIDHINGGGTKERKEWKNTTRYYRHLLRHIESGGKDYQLLCANCNQIKRYENQEYSESI